MDRSYQEGPCSEHFREVVPWNVEAGHCVCEERQILKVVGEDKEAEGSPTEEQNR